MVRSRWWSKSRGLPAPAYAGWLAAMRSEPDRSTQILAWAEAAEGYVVASPAVLSITDHDGAWQHTGWHEIESGLWNAETRRLSWARYGGRRGSATLTAPGRVPEMFRERIAASIVVERFLPVSGDRGVILNGRRDLSQTSPVFAWHATLGRGLNWRVPGLREAVDDALAELRSEYDPGHVP